MSEQERPKKMENDEDAGTEDVEAHVKQRPASDEGDDGDDVEAHVKDKG